MSTLARTLSRRITLLAGTAAIGAVALVAAPLAAQSVGVTVDGNPVSFNPAPLTRAGRVFVPLRGVFERLGATVVYSDGAINATSSNGTAIALRIGSNNATVNGTPQTLDVAPFIVGSSTYVPLRFVSEALGAQVDYDANNRMVALSSNGQGGRNPYPETITPQPRGDRVGLRNVQPGSGSTVGSMRPTIQADFSQNVDPNSIRISLDGQDVTANSTRSANGIVLAPSRLQSGQHTVRVTGTSQSGYDFDRQWGFTTGSIQGRNGLSLVGPTDGSTTDGNFTVRGNTAPDARVHIVAGTVANFGSFVFPMGGTQTSDVTADQNGRFSQSFSVNAPNGSTIGLTVTSTDPQSQENAEARLSLHVQR